MEIPPFTEAHREILDRVQPLVWVDGQLCTFDLPDLVKMSFLWDPKNPQPYGHPLEAARTVQTLHTFGYCGLFKPSIAEVLCQLPDDLDGIVAFSIAGPGDATDLNNQKDCINAGFHRATVTLYRHKAAPW